MAGRPKGIPKTGGRQKGVPNKTTRSAKEAIAFAAAGLGGAERLMDWAKEDPDNEKAFWTSIYPKLLPLTVGGDPDSDPVKMSHTVEFIGARPAP